MVLVRELEVRYNYSGVKNFWRKIRKKNTRPLRFWQTDFQFQTGFQQIVANKVTMPRYCVFYMETKVFFITPLNILFQKKGDQQNNLCDYTPTNKFERSQPIASDIFFSLLIGVLSFSWLIQFLFTCKVLQSLFILLCLSFNSLFMFSIILFLIMQLYFRASFILCNVLSVQN